MKDDPPNKKYWTIQDFLEFWKSKGVDMKEEKIRLACESLEADGLITRTTIDGQERWFAAIPEGPKN